jgi:hypothetical protein
MKFKSIQVIIMTLMINTNTKSLEFPKVETLAQQPSDHLQRLSSYPYISGDTFRGFCDFIIDKTNKFIDTDKIQNGDTIFMDAYTEFLDFFFQYVHPNIKSNYILVTHNSCKSDFNSYLKYLSDDKIIAWFGQNLTLDHKKAFPLPIGLANRYWKHGNIDIINDQIKNIPNKDTLLYVNMTITNPKRLPIYNYFASQKFCTLSKNKEFKYFINDMAKSKFVISPPGSGTDCLRTWEALYLGTIPIIETSKLDPLFQDLPIVISPSPSEGLDGCEQSQGLPN